MYHVPRSGVKPRLLYPAVPTTRHGVKIEIKVSDGAERVGTVVKATAQVYTVDLRRRLTAVGVPVTMTPTGARVFAFDFAHRVPGYYRIDCEVTGRLANQQPFTQTWSTSVAVKPEDLRVLAVEQQAVGRHGDGNVKEARIQLTVDAETDGRIEASASLWNDDLSEEIPTLPFLRNIVQVRKGTQIVTVPLPKVAAEPYVSAVVLLTVQPVRNGEPDPAVTYWGPGTVDWSNGRFGFVRLALRAVRP
jgi:hypothetical protein